MSRIRGVAGRLAAAAAVLSAGLAGSTGAFAQCAMCRTALNGSADPLGRAISTSAIFMISMPLMVFASVFGWIVITYQRARRSEARDERPVAARGEAQATAGTSLPVEGRTT